MTNRRIAAAAVLALAMTCTTWPLYGQIEAAKPMVAGAHPSFEVATITHSDPDDHNPWFHLYGRNIFIENQTMDDLLSMAYEVQVKQIVDAPAWFASEHFDIKGFPSAGGYPNVNQYREMVRKLLLDRFHLQFKRDQREMSCFALTVAKGGPKIAPTESPPDAGQDQTGGGDGGHVSWRFTNNPISEFAKFLQSEVLDRPVVDQTGLKGRYDFKLEWTADPDAVTDSSAVPGFFTAIQEQDGLKVTATKGEVDVLAITHAERPSAN